MKNKMSYGILVFCFLAMLISACKEKPDTLFNLLPPEQTGIHFSNTITENDTLNILKTEYVYNGGGVGIGDFNNDGLQDIFFSGNMVSNKLYLNKGNLTFEDITPQAGVDGGGKWCSGVAVVDINNDGWLDIYVSATLKGDSLSRANLLYINNGKTKGGIPAFTEAAAEYGIADTGFSTNAAFFDYDKDGDLDLYVLTNFIDKKIIPSTYRKKIDDGSAINNDKLYRNNGNGSFTDVTKEAGILMEGYGLGIAISDINLDGWPDIYVTNDYLSNDLLYINNKNGTFTNRASGYLKHTSSSAMGNDVVDINNDGLVDIIALDMLPEDNKRKKKMLHSNNYATYINNKLYGYDHQYLRNTLQLNNGPTPEGYPTFSEIGQLANIYQTDWSWAPLVADFDNDGYRDIIITNGFPRDVTDRDFALYSNGPAGAIASVEFLQDSIPQVKIANYAFRNNGNLTFSDITKEWGLAIPSYSNGAAYADLDNDGDLDFVVNNIEDSAFVYKNLLYDEKESKNKSFHYLRVKLVGDRLNPAALGAKIRIKFGGGKQLFYEQSPYRGYLSSVENIAHFGLGAYSKVDSIEVFWPDGKYQLLKNMAADQELIVKSKAAIETPVNLALNIANKIPFQDAATAYGLSFTHEEDDKIDFYVQRTLPHKYSQSGPGIAVGDIDGNGLDDFYIGGSVNHKGTFFLQKQDGSFAATTENVDWPKLKLEEDMASLLFDADNDGDLDLYVVSGSYEYPEESKPYQDRLYKNNGKGSFSLDTSAVPQFFTSGSCVKAADYDQDGDLDLFVGGRVVPGKYPQAPPSYILRNEGGKFIDVTAQVCPGLTDLGMVSDALWSDFDNDGKVDLVIAGEWMPITFFKNENGKFIINNKQSLNPSIPQSTSDSVGWWNSLVGGDFDQDGDMDYLAGNLGLNTNYVASPQQPLTVYAKDFDGNGTFDPVLSCYMKGEDGKMAPFPMHTRDDLLVQINPLKKKYPAYHNYAVATIDDVLPAEDQKDALVLKANYFASSYIENKGGGRFEIRALPVEAQFAPVYGMLCEDVDGDGHLDVLLVGNNYGAEVFTGRYDAMVGLYLKGNGKGDFEPVKLKDSGFFVGGDAKGIAKLYTQKGEELILVTQNQNKLKVFSKANKKDKDVHLIKLEPMDAWAEITRASGKKEKREFYYGSTYLSQSTRKLAIDNDVVSVVIYTFNGGSRSIKPEEVL